MVSKRVKTFFDYDDSCSTCSSTRATLCIYLPDSDNPNELTKKLGIQPSRTQVKGEVRNDRVRNWPTAWFLESKEKVTSKEVRRHIDWLLEQLDGKSEVIRELQTDGSEIHLSANKLPKRRKQNETRCLYHCNREAGIYPIRQK